MNKTDELIFISENHYNSETNIIEGIDIYIANTQNDTKKHFCKFSWNESEKATILEYKNTDLVDYTTNINRWQQIAKIIDDACDIINGAHHAIFKEDL